MIYSENCKALLDACVLYPAPLRDILLRLAQCELYRPLWSDKIHEEWTRNLIANRPDLDIEKLKITVSKMNEAFPDASVYGYETIVASLKLRDDDDKHVVAAAVKANANIIVTENLKDFPEAYLKGFNIDVQSADQFISGLIELNPEKAERALLNLVKSLRTPPKSRGDILETFRKNGLVETYKKWS